jgi:hypothetical protein
MLHLQGVSRKYDPKDARVRVDLLFLNQHRIQGPKVITEYSTT